MSRIVMLVEPAEGHFNACVPIISKLVERQHQIVCITGRGFKQRVESLGGQFHPLSTQWDPAEQEIYEFFSELKQLKGLAQIKYYLKHIMFDQVPDVIAVLNEVLESFKADVIICDTFMIAGNWMTELKGIPSVRLSVLPLSLPYKEFAPFGLGLPPADSFLSKLKNNALNMMFEKVLFKDVQSHCNAIRKQVGLPHYDKSFFVKGYEIPNLVLHVSIPQFEYPRPYFPDNFRFIGAVLNAPQVNYQWPDWWSLLDKNRPTVLINQGTVAKNHQDLIAASIQALKNEALNIIILPVKQGDILDLPSNVFTADYIPFGNLLPYIDVMVTNGGFGGTQQALAHGIPLVVAGATEDKMEVAARVDYAKVGINLKQQQPSADSIKTAVLTVLSATEYKQAANALKSAYADYDVAVLAVKYIEELIEPI